MKPDISEITIVVAVDDEYIKKLHWTYQTWIKFKPEMLYMPFVIIYDESQLSPANKQFNLFKALHRAPVVLAPWSMHNAENQREKMLTSLVFAPAEFVNTKWYLKLDADTFAKEAKTWIKDEWFVPSKGKEPVCISSPWGYTKPGNLLDILDDWGDTVDVLKNYPRLNIPHAENSETVSSPRFASWVMFGRTSWTKEIIKTCPNRKLPVPSQDTFLYYCAHRRGDYYVRDRMGNYGWGHISRFHNLKPECIKLLGNIQFADNE